MKSLILPLGLAGLLLTAPSSRAAAPDLQSYIEQVQDRAHAMLGATGFDFKGQSVTVSASVNPDGRLTAVRVAHSSGSRRADRAVESVLEKLVVADPPVGLVDGAVTLTVTGEPIVEAKTP
jgi:TonB family protein